MQVQLIKVEHFAHVTDTILWQGHHDRVMQLNWLYFCGICHMMPLKVWPNTALGCNRQSICMPQLQPLYVQLLWYPMYYPEGMKARVSPVQWSKPYSKAPTQDSNPGGRIQNHKRWPLHYHCTQSCNNWKSTMSRVRSIRVRVLRMSWVRGLMGRTWIQQVSSPCPGVCGSSPNPRPK